MLAHELLQKRALLRGALACARPLAGACGCLNDAVEGGTGPDAQNRLGPEFRLLGESGEELIGMAVAKQQHGRRRTGIGDAEPPAVHVTPGIL